MQSQLESTVSASVTVLGYPGIDGADSNVLAGPPNSTDAVGPTDPDVMYAFRTKHPRCRFVSVDGVEYVQAAIPFRNGGVWYVLVARKSIDEIGDAIGVVRRAFVDAALAGLVVVHADAHTLYSGLVRGGALATVIVSGIAGALTLALIWRGRFEAARYSGAVAVAAVVAAWAIARYPVLLPGLTVDHAAAPHDTLVALVVAVLAGGVILFPALGLLFTITLRRDEPGAGPGEQPLRGPLRGIAVAPRVSVALLIVGIGMLNAAAAPWAHGIGVVSLFGFVVAGFAAIVAPALADDA